MSATGVPFNVAFTALMVFQVRTEDWPLVIEVALALIPAATGPVEAPVTVTVAEPESVAPVELVPMIV